MITMNAGKSLPLERHPAYCKARQLMSQRGIPVEEHHLLRETVASCLIQMGPPWDEARLSQDPRWGHKIERDLTRPYTDRQVFDRVEQLERDTRMALSYVNQKGARYVGGSLVKGRMGANSDADQVVEGGWSQARADQLDALPGWRVALFSQSYQNDDPELLYGGAYSQDGHDVCLQALTGERFVNLLASFDLKAVVEPGGSLREVHHQALTEKGYRVENDLVVPPWQAPFHLIEMKTPRMPQAG